MAYSVGAKTDVADAEDEVDVKTEIKVDRQLKCVLMRPNGKQELVLNDFSQYTVIKFCKQLMSSVKDEHTLCQIKNEHHINDFTNPVDNADILSHRIEDAISNDVKTVYFVIASIDKVSKSFLPNTAKLFLFELICVILDNSHYSAIHQCM